MTYEQKAELIKDTLVEFRSYVPDYFSEKWDHFTMMDEAVEAIHFLVNELNEAQLFRRNIAGYLGETADAIENPNVERGEVAAILRKTSTRLLKEEVEDEEHDSST